MAGWNSVVDYSQANLPQVQEALGILRFVTVNNWDITLSGILFQGGQVACGANVSVVVPFNVGFQQQVLGIFVQAIHTPAGGVNQNSGKVYPGFTLAQFELGNDGVAKDFFWIALGV